MSENKLVKNTERIPCANCNNAHEYISSRSDHAKCGTPRAFSKTRAEEIAKEYGGKIVDIPKTEDDTFFVVLDDSARKLPRSRAGGILDQGRIYEGIRSM